MTHQALPHTPAARARRWATVALAATLGVAGLAAAQVRGPDQTLPGAGAAAQFGGFLNAEADFDRDGYRDLIVGSANIAPDDERGRVQIFRGSRNGLMTTPSFSYDGPMDWAQVGASPVVADVNGDGWPDLVVGATNWSGAQPYAGAVLVFLGSAQGFPAMPSQVIEGPSTNSFFGFGIRALGDFNGDGKADIAVSALGADGSVGEILVYAGSANGLAPTPVSTLKGAAPWMYFGRVFAAGDFDGDGIADIVVGMPHSVPGIPAMVWVYKGTRDGYANARSDTLFPVLADPNDADLFADSIAVLGDVDGDGFADLAVGAPMHLAADLTPVGLITVYFGSAGGLSASGRTQLLKGEDVPRLMNLGGNMLGQRDMNGDGRPDLLVGPSWVGRPNDETVPWPGSVWVYSAGAGGLASKPTLLARGQQGSRDELGTSLEAGQVMGSKALDLIAGSSLYNVDGAQHEGIVRIYGGRIARP